MSNRACQPEDKPPAGATGSLAEPGIWKSASATAVRNPGAAVYGAITVGALVAVESPRRETYGQTVGAVLIALVLYWFAHAYATLLSHRVREAEPLSRWRFRAALGHELPLLAGAVPPLGALAFAWVVGAPLTAAVVAASWAAAGMVVAVEFVVGLRAGLRGLALLAQTGVGAALGLLIIVLRVVLH